jgi:hypothetical protein
MEHNRAYVVSCHYDSRVTDINDFTNEAPGADNWELTMMRLALQFPWNWLAL